MKASVYDPSTLRSVFEALVMMPPDARAIAVRDVTFVGVGVRTNAMAIPPAGAAEGWIVCLAERDGARDTVLHELAHVYHGHPHGGAEAEAEACATAASWGAAGHSADVALHAGHARTWQAAAPRVFVGSRGGTITVACGRCAAACEVLAPVVAGIPAEVGLGCSSCGWFELVKVAPLVSCPVCGKAATATWTPDATPSAPEVRLVCECGTNVSLRLHTEPDEPERPPRSTGLWLVDRAAGQIAGVEASLRRLALAAEPDGVAVESCRSVVLWSRQLLVRAARELQGDPRRPIVDDAAGELAHAGERLSARDLAASADAVASAGRTLNALLEPAGPRSPADVAAESNP